MVNPEILNRKEVKKIIEVIKEQWGASPELDYGFLRNEKNRVYLVNREIDNIDLNKVRMNSAGLYFGELSNGGLRLSIEGSEIVAKTATKSVIEVSDDLANEWMQGHDIPSETKSGGLVIIKNNKDILGCGKIKEGKILNYVPKTRRQAAIA